jgi:iron(III) transport system permease protein
MSALFSLLIVTPIIALAIVALSGTSENFEYIQQTVLSDYVLNTLYLVVMVAILVSIIGIPLAWLLASCEFVGKRFFNWALILPLAMPGYLIAYTYTDMFDYAGVVQRSLREVFGWTSPNDYWFFEVRSLTGAAIMLALVLFHYVLLLAKANFKNQPASYTFAARSIGHSPLSSFFKVSLPMAKNAILGAVLLVMMETMADFATVHYFAVSTLTTAVYDTWLGYYDLASAAKLSLVMMVGVIGLVVLEQQINKASSGGGNAKVSQTSVNYNLSGWRSGLAWLLCLCVFLLGFGIPAVTLLSYALEYWQEVWHLDVLKYAGNSVLIAGTTAGTCVIMALIFNFAYRNKGTKFNQTVLTSAGSGYAIPGTVLAIAVLILYSYLDNLINASASSLGLEQPGLLLSGTIVAIVTSHVVRFQAIANKSVQDQYAQINKSLDWAASSLGRRLSTIFTRVHWPLLRRGVWVSVLLVFVESMKELPAALLLRPFDFDTLPTFVYQFASDEQLEQAALGALLIVLVGLVPLIFINRTIDKPRLIE